MGSFDEAGVTPEVKPPVQGKFVSGNLFRHIAVMSLTSSVGLMAIFVVDFLSLFYVSLLRDDRLTAGVGFATTVMFLAISANIGSMIAGAAMVARRIGARDEEGARRIAVAAQIDRGRVPARVCQSGADAPHERTGRA